MNSSSSSARPVVLIVDDYTDTIEMYAAYLGLVGFCPLKATNGHDALRLAVSEIPDVILMDLSLPGLDGFEVTRRLKDNPDTRHIPVIALTAQATPQQYGQLLAIGFHDLIIKPCLPDVLADEVDRVLKRIRAREPQRGATQPAA